MAFVEPTPMKNPVHPWSSDHGGDGRPVVWPRIVKITQGFLPATREWEIYSGLVSYVRSSNLICYDHASSALLVYVEFPKGETVVTYDLRSVLDHLATQSGPDSPRLLLDCRDVAVLLGYLAAALGLQTRLLQIATVPDASDLTLQCRDVRAIGWDHFGPPDGGGGTLASHSVNLTSDDRILCASYEYGSPMSPRLALCLPWKQYRDSVLLDIHPTGDVNADCPEYREKAPKLPPPLSHVLERSSRRSASSAQSPRPLRLHDQGLLRALGITPKEIGRISMLQHDTEGAPRWGQLATWIFGRVVEADNPTGPGLSLYSGTARGTCGSQAGSELPATFLELSDVEGGTSALTRVSVWEAESNEAAIERIKKAHPSLENGELNAGDPPSQTEVALGVGTFLIVFRRWVFAARSLVCGPSADRVWSRFRGLLDQLHEPALPFLPLPIDEYSRSGSHVSLSLVGSAGHVVAVHDAYDVRIDWDAGLVELEQAPGTDSQIQFVSGSGKVTTLQLPTN